MHAPEADDESVSSRVAAVLARIAGINPSLNAFITVFEHEAMQAAAALDDELRRGRCRGPLHGLTVSLKDLIDVKGAPTTAASRIRDGHIARDDARIVARLRDAGAVIIGKTNLHEVALGTTSDESAFGAVRNPHNPARSPGGSSGGSAAAVAAGMGWASVGTDTGGSIRIPSAACGVVGLKPTFGEVPVTGVVPLSVSLDHVGPIARNVSDAWLLYSVLAAAPMPPPTRQTIDRFRFCRLGGYFVEKLDGEVRARFEEAVTRLSRAGAAITHAEIGGLGDVHRTYVDVALPEAYAFYARFLEDAPERFSASVRTRLEMGSRISREEYIVAQETRGRLRARVDAALAGCDALMLPALAIPAPLIGAATASTDTGDEQMRPLTLRLTQLFNLTGHPAVSIPCGRTREGLPCGLQLVGRRHHTNDLLSAALAAEAIVASRELS